MCISHKGVYIYTSVESRVVKGEERLTGVGCNGEQVHVRRILRCKRLGHCKSVPATGEGSHNSESRFTINFWLTFWAFWLIFQI